MTLRAGSKSKGSDQVMQIRAPNGASFLDVATVNSIDSSTKRDSSVDKRQVEWNGRTWICKEKDVTLNEVVGYQIAAASGLPLQPWIAFFRSGEHEGRAGMLIELWRSSGFVHVSWPAKQRPKLVASALAFCVFDRFEWPVWLVSADYTEFRLIDLERIGPSLRWPPQRTFLRGYKTGTDAALREARETAQENSLGDRFDSALRNLLQLDFAAVIDFSGHPNDQALRKVMVKGLEARQWELRRIIDGVIPPRKKTPKRARPRLPRRRLEAKRIGVRHPQHGWMYGRIELRPAPRRKWNVRWDIETIDYDMELSSRWFGASEYAGKLNRTLDELEVENPRLRLCSYGGVRWGNERNMDEQSARSLVASLKRLWEEILQKWQQQLVERQKATCSTV